MICRSLKKHKNHAAKKRSKKNKTLHIALKKGQKESLKQMFEKSAGRQFDCLTQMQLQTVKIAQIDALSQCFVDFLPVLRCFNHTNLNLYHYAGNNPVKYVDQAGKKLELTVDKSEQVENMHKNSGYYRDYLAVTPEMINAKESNFTAKNIDQLIFAATVF